MMYICTEIGFYIDIQPYKYVHFKKDFKLNSLYIIYLIYMHI